MNKLEKYKLEKAKAQAQDGGDTVGESEEAYCRGFDAALALDLPVKFNKWYIDEYLPAVVFGEATGISKEVASLFRKWKDDLKFLQNERDLLAYKYWIDNVYKPE